jgi:hypothetical protein
MSRIAQIKKPISAIRAIRGQTALAMPAHKFNDFANFYERLPAAPPINPGRY